MRKYGSFLATRIDAEYKIKQKYENKKETDKQIKKNYGGTNNENGSVFKRCI